MKQKKISVCMAAYNGQNYILEQLSSIYQQSRQPDEVIICDDASEDNTVSIIREFIMRHGLEERWHLYCNEENKGYPGNFYYAMSLCRGDIVFLADQDDIWEVNKVERMAQIICDNEKILLLSSAYYNMDRYGRVINKRFSRDNDQTIQKVSVEQILYKYQWPGMSMCYVREFGQKVLEKVQHTRIEHDMALALCAAEEDGFVSIGECLQYLRNHEGNVSMRELRIWKRLSKKRKILEIQLYLDTLKGILENAALQQMIHKDVILRKQQLMQERLVNLEHGKILRIIRQYWTNKDMVRITTMICDCLICFGKVEIEH